MEFTSQLSAFQGIIISADNIHSFERLSAKGGNEEKIQFITQRLMKYLRDNNYIQNKDLIECNIPITRKFALYIILNSDISVLEEMLELDGMDQLIWTVPTIPKCLMCEIIWSLYLDKFVYEIISFSHPQLALEVAAAFLSHFKYFSPSECPNKLKQFLTAIYKLICRLNFYQLDNNNLSDKLTAATNNFQNYLEYFVTPPNDYKLDTLSKDELYKHKGKNMFAALLLLDSCIEEFTGSQDIDFIDDVYKLTHKDISKDICEYKVRDIKSIMECLEECNMLLLEACKELVMDISIDIYCAWSEFEENGRSMQQIIGEHCYKLRLKLLNTEGVSEHHLVIMLEQISRKPVVIKDIINNTENSIIIENINTNSEEKKLWLQALLHKDQLCDNIDLLNILESNLNVYNEDELKSLFQLLNGHISCAENEEYIERLTIKVFQRCSHNTKQQILEEHFSDKCFYDKKETTEFNNILNEVFNKLVARQDADLTDVLTVFLQNPKLTYKMIFALAIQSSRQIDIMLKVIQILEKFSNHYYIIDTEPCIIKVAKKFFDKDFDTDEKRNNLIKFTGGLKATNIIPAPKLLLLVIMPKTHKALIEKDISGLSVQVKLLKEEYSVNDLLQYRAPMLAMLAQILEVVRWRINTFSTLAPSATHKALELQKILVETYYHNPNIPENESTWIKSKLRNIQALNMYYYRIFWNPPGSNFLEVLGGITVNKDVDMTRLLGLISEVICACTQQEWCAIWDSLAAFEGEMSLKIIHDALSVVVAAEKAHRTEASWACLLYCFRNLAYLIRYKYFKEPLNDKQVTTFATTVISIMKQVGEENVEEIGTLLLPLMSYLVERSNEYNIDLYDHIFEQIENNNILGVIRKVFTNHSS